MADAFSEAESLPEAEAESLAVALVDDYWACVEAAATVGDNIFMSASLSLFLLKGESLPSLVLIFIRPGETRRE